MARDDDDAVFLLVEKDGLDFTIHAANLRAVLVVVSEAYCARNSAKEEERVLVVRRCADGCHDVEHLPLALLEGQAAEDDLPDCTLFSVVARLGQAAVSAPDADRALDVSGDHATAVGAEGDNRQGRLVHELVLSRLPLVLIPEGDAAFKVREYEHLPSDQPIAID